MEYLGLLPLEGGLSQYWSHHIQWLSEFVMDKQPGKSHVFCDNKIELKNVDMEWPLSKSIVRWLHCTFHSHRHAAWVSFCIDVISDAIWRTLVVCQQIEAARWTHQQTREFSYTGHVLPINSLQDWFCVSIVATYKCQSSGFVLQWQTVACSQWAVFYKGTMYSWVMPAFGESSRAKQHPAC